ncbi:MAG: thermonuclease family protein [Anaerolineae bacterium]|nr:thermonuclease family protein [Anaerolineae bacterium]
MRRVILLVSLFLLLSASALALAFDNGTSGAIASQSDPTATPVPGEREEALVVHVTDGDTIVVRRADGLEYRVRFIGIDTPETHHPDVGADYLGYEAADFVKQFIHEGDTVILEKDISEYDIYDRLLRYVFVAGADGSEIFVNAEMVRAGFAHAKFYDPDVKYKLYLYALELEAQKAKLGIWGPRPTPPAVESAAQVKDTVWAAGETGESVDLLYDAAQGDPVMAFPAGAEVIVRDVFWMPATMSYWYWLELNEFRGWAEAGAFVVAPPDEIFPGPALPLKAYDQAYITGDAPLDVYTAPGDAEPAGQLDADSRPQVERITYSFDTESWWYWVDTQTVDGWVEETRLSKRGE